MATRLFFQPERPSFLIQCVHNKTLSLDVGKNCVFAVASMAFVYTNALLQGSSRSLEPSKMAAALLRSASLKSLDGSGDERCVTRQLSIRQREVRISEPSA